MFWILGICLLVIIITAGLLASVKIDSIYDDEDNEDDEYVSIDDLLS